jgi:hypothetical protein
MRAANPDEIAINFTSYYEALSNLFMGFTTYCPRFAEYQALYPTSIRLQTALCNFHASIVSCCKHAIEATQRPCLSLQGWSIPDGLSLTGPRGNAPPQCSPPVF